MSELEQKLSEVMSNPEMMQKIMTLAQSMRMGGAQQSAPQQTSEPPKQEIPAGAFPEIDLSMLQKISGFARQSGIDKNQQTLRHALAPYLSNRRISKLERAMRAAKMAGFATSFLGR